VVAQASSLVVLVLARTNPHRLNRLRKKAPTPFVIPSEARNLSFFSWG
jgi:hypothetical protein